MAIVTACDGAGKVVARQKRTQGSPRSRGLCRLLPQLVGSFDPGGGVSGDRNAARVGPINSILKKNPGHRKTQGSQIGGHQGKGRSAYRTNLLGTISSAASIEKSIRCASLVICSAPHVGAIEIKASLPGSPG